MRIILIVSLMALFVGCGGGGGGGGGGSTSSTSSTSSTTTTAPSSIAADVAACADGGALSISGTISYERVPFSTTATAGLDYNNIQTLPARGVEVQALGSSNCVIEVFSNNGMSLKRWTFKPLPLVAHGVV